MEESGFEAMGKPIPNNRRQEAYDWLRTLGIEIEAATLAVGSVATALERDKPYEAMAEGMKFLDLTGTYRLFAILLTPAPVTTTNEKGEVAVYEADLFYDIIQSLANKRLIEKSIKDPVGAQMTSELIDRIKEYCKEKGFENVY